MAHKTKIIHLFRNGEPAGKGELFPLGTIDNRPIDEAQFDITINDTDVVEVERAIFFGKSEVQSDGVTWTWRIEDEE